MEFSVAAQHGLQPTRLRLRLSERLNPAVGRHQASRYISERPAMALSNCDVSGPSDAHVIVFLHGVAANRKMWSPQFAALADAFRVVVLDLPGHGECAHVPFRIEAALQTIGEAMDSTVRPAMLVGLSLGGYVAMEFAAHNPAKVAGLVLASCSDNTHSRWVWLLTRVTTAVFRLLGYQRLAAWEQAGLRKMLPPAIAEPLIAGGFNYDAIPLAYREVFGKNYRAILAHYPGPVLIVNGERDWFTRQGEKSLLAATRQGRLEIVPQAGHLCNLEQPHAFTSAVRRFAQEINW
jgi:pimeloyl-ACP methyl ester carboxylesterase